MHFDTGIVGLGAMGSMTALELARRGRAVIGFDRFRPPHTLGSSHGQSRIMREAYFEHPQYVPLVQRAYQGWAELERSAGAAGLLYRRTGGLMIGPAEGVLVSGVRRSAGEHGLPVEALSAAQVRGRFPWFVPADGEVGLFEPQAGVLFPETAIRTALALAESAGAELHYDEPVMEWMAGDSITVRTGAGSYAVERLVLSAGAWMAGALPRTSLPLTITRQAVFWFEPSPAAAKSFAEMPVFIWEWEPDRMFYGFPDLGHGVKVAIHREGEAARSDQPRRPADPREAEPLRAVLASRIPGLGSVRQTAVCLYTNTPSGDFLLDRHPNDPRVMLASPCSGHGFKFAPAIGEVLADLVDDQPPKFDLTPFQLGRVAQRNPT